LISAFQSVISCH